jgi:hypothetical protein
MQTKETNAFSRRGDETGQQKEQTTNMMLNQKTQWEVERKSILQFHLYTEFCITHKVNVVEP